MFLCDHSTNIQYLIFDFVRFRELRVCSIL